MNTSQLRGLSVNELERIRQKLWSQLKQADPETRRQIQVDICWIQKVQQEAAERNQGSA